MLLLFDHGPSPKRPHQRPYVLAKNGNQLTEKLTAYWPLGKPRGLVDLVKGLTLTRTGTARPGSTNIYESQACVDRFAGSTSDYLRATLPSALGYPSSLSHWVWCDDTAAYNTFEVWNGAFQAWSFTANLKSDGGNWDAYEAGTWAWMISNDLSGSGHERINTVTGCPMKSWMNVVVVNADATHRYIYCNGRAGTTGTTNETPSGCTTVEISNASSIPLVGMISDCAIWNGYALDATEVAMMWDRRTRWTWQYAQPSTKTYFSISGATVYTETGLAVAASALTALTDLEHYRDAGLGATGVATAAVADLQRYKDLGLAVQAAAVVAAAADAQHFQDVNLAVPVAGVVSGADAVKYAEVGRPIAAVAVVSGYPLLVPLTDGTQLANSGSNYSLGPRSLGFTFSFFGTAYTDVYVNSNGNLTFGAANSGFGNAALPTVGYPRVASFWDYLPTTGGEIREAAGTGYYAVSWVDVQAGTSAGRVTCQAILCGAGNAWGLPTDSIVLTWRRADGTFGGDATVGLNKGDGARYAVPTAFGVGGSGGLVANADSPALVGRTFLVAPDGAGGYMTRELAGDVEHYKDLGLSAAAAGVIAGTDLLHALETGLPVTVVAGVTGTDSFAGTGETGLPITAAGQVSATDVQRYKDLGLAVGSIGLITETDVQHYKDLGLAVQAAAVVTGTDQAAGAGEVGRQVLASATVSGADLQKYRELGLAITGAAPVAVGDVQRYRDTGLTVTILGTASEADVKRYHEEQRAINAAATVAVTDLQHGLEKLLPVQAQALLAVTDRQHYKDNLALLASAATTATDGYHWQEALLEIVATATVTGTDVPTTAWTGEPAITWMVPQARLVYEVPRAQLVFEVRRPGR
jgi:hypothetical protein